MARKKIPRTLAPLPKAPHFGEEESKQARLLEILRAFARSAQTDKAQLFYSLNEVAEKFKVPASLVGKVFAQLEGERLLRRIRGSRTILEGRNARQILSVRAMVVLAVSMSCFLTLHDYRSFFIQVRRAL